MDIWPRFCITRELLPKERERKTKRNKRQLRQKEPYVQKHTNRGMRAMSLRKAFCDNWKRYIAWRG